jgi:TolB protein
MRRTLRHVSFLLAAWGTLASVALTLAQQQAQPQSLPAAISPGLPPKAAPIAVPRSFDIGTKPDPLLGSELTQVLRSDLQSSNALTVVDPSTYPRPASAASFRDWHALGAQFVVKVAHSVSGNRLLLKGELFETQSSRALWPAGKAFAGGIDEARLLVHRLADALVQELTGDPGVFSTRIAYAQRNRIANQVTRQLYLIDYDGHGRRQLTSNGGTNIFPRWSRDASSVLFSSTANGRWEIMRYRLGGKSPRILVSRPNSTALGASPSPDGKHFLASLSHSGNAEIYLLDMTGNVLKQLTNDPSIDISPTWSPDGKRIAWVSDRSGEPQIHAMNADGTGTTRLTYRGNFNQEPDWSPKGDKISFTGRDANGQFDIFALDLARGNQVDRYTLHQGDNEGARWSPDGKQLVFSSTRSGASHLHYLALDTGTTRLVPNAGPDARTPAWSPRPAP